MLSYYIFQGSILYRRPPVLPGRRYSCALLVLAGPAPRLTLRVGGVRVVQNQLLLL